MQHGSDTLGPTKPPTPALAPGTRYTARAVLRASMRSPVQPPTHVATGLCSRPTAPSSRPWPDLRFLSFSPCCGAESCLTLTGDTVRGTGSGIAAPGPVSMTARIHRLAECVWPSRNGNSESIRACYLVGARLRRGWLGRKLCLMPQ